MYIFPVNLESPKADLYQIIQTTTLIRKTTKPTRIFSYRWGATHRKIEDLSSICPLNIILNLFRLLVIPYSWIYILF